MAGSRNNNTNNGNANIDPNGGFKTVAFGFDKNDVTLYIASLRKKMKQMEEEFQEKLTLAMENPAASSEVLKHERESIRAEVEKAWGEKLNDRNSIIKQQQTEINLLTRELEDYKVKNEALRNQLSSVVSKTSAANARSASEGNTSNAENAEMDAETLLKVEEYKALADEYKSRAEKYKRLSDEYQSEISKFKSNSDQYQKYAEQCKSNLDQLKANADAYKENAEKYKAAADQYKANAEQYKTYAEQCKANLDQYKANTEQYKSCAESYKAGIDKLQASTKAMYEKLTSSLSSISGLVTTATAEGKKTWEGSSKITFPELPTASANIKELKELKIVEPEPVKAAEPQKVDLIEPDEVKIVEVKSIEKIEEEVDAAVKVETEKPAPAPKKAEPAPAPKKTEPASEAKKPESSKGPEKPVETSSKPANNQPAAKKPAPSAPSANDFMNSGLEDLLADDISSLVEDISPTETPKPAKPATKFTPKPTPPMIDDDLSSLLADPSSDVAVAPAQQGGADDFSDLLSVDEDDLSSDDLSQFMVDNSNTDSAKDEYAQFGDLFATSADDEPDNKFEIKSEPGNSIGEKSASTPEKPADKKSSDPFDFSFLTDDSDEDDMSTNVH